MHLELFMRCVVAVYTTQNNLITCECQYIKTYENVTDHFTYIIFYELSDIYYCYYYKLS